MLCEYIICRAIKEEFIRDLNEAMDSRKIEIRGLKKNPSEVEYENAFKKLLSSEISDTMKNRVKNENRKQKKMKVDAENDE